MDYKGLFIGYIRKNNHIFSKSSQKINFQTRQDYLCDISSTNKPK